MVGHVVSREAASVLMDIMVFICIYCINIVFRYLFDCLDADNANKMRTRSIRIAQMQI